MTHHNAHLSQHGIVTGEAGMSKPTVGETAAAARHVITAMVQPGVEVSVRVDRLLVNDRRTVLLSRGERPETALVSVEMIGPDEHHPLAQKTIADTGEARAWCNDEILPAARRAAEGIIRRNPGWRRDAGRKQPRHFG